MRRGEWLNEPKIWSVDGDCVTIQTEPGTDFWQRTYYGFRNSNAPAYLWCIDHNFTLSITVSSRQSSLFDQSGIFGYIDDENWFKASIEYEDHRFSRLGSVVTNQGHSDWATMDINHPNEIWYRLSRRGSDFLLEHALDGSDYHQMRVFHMSSLGETLGETGKMRAADIPSVPIHVGVYACSPTEGSFVARFTGISVKESDWRPYRL
jgi:regulation of enolase protein 1 (concanavalin A-like superfamily)